MSKERKLKLGKYQESWKIKRKRSREEKRDTEEEPKTINKMVISTYLSIITLNVNGIMPDSEEIAEQNGYKNTRPICILLITDQF